jgi:signal transduction histidine kinase
VRARAIVQADGNHKPAPAKARAGQSPMLQQAADPLSPRQAGFPPADLLGLAPLHLPNLRVERYFGESAGIPLASFAATDQDIIRDVYRQINNLLALLERREGSESVSSHLHAYLGTRDFEQLRTGLRSLGRATVASTPPDRVTGRAIHDIRGGAVAVLLLRLEIAGPEPFTKDELRTLFMLARDHGKIIRSTVCDMDAVRRQEDLAPQSHSVRLFMEKWHGAAIKSPGRPGARLFVETRFDGAVTECCLECAAVDRVLYNLMANARRHHAGGRMDLTIFEIPGQPGESLRFVLSNAVSEADQRRLGELAGQDEPPGDLGALFEAGVSTTGSGLGLAIVADLVTQAFGVATEHEALRLGYFGARLFEGKFTVWFHWPIAQEGLGRPARSDASEDIAQALENTAALT